MFSGIVEIIGHVIDMQMHNGCMHVCIDTKSQWNDINIGDSISVNGVCLTVTQYKDNIFHATIVPETLRVTNLYSLKVGNSVNLERSLKADARVGGHHVQGHVDATGRILELAHDQSNAWLVKISVPQHLSKYIVNKGFITLDGMSITVIEATPTWFTVTLIPHTQAVTITKHYQIGSEINIEVDMMAKYIAKLIEAQLHANAN